MSLVGADWKFLAELLCRKQNLILWAPRSFKEGWRRKTEVFSAKLLFTRFCLLAFSPSGSFSVSRQQKKKIRIQVFREASYETSARLKIRLLQFCKYQKICTFFRLAQKKKKKSTSFSLCYFSFSESFQSWSTVSWNSCFMWRKSDTQWLSR